MSKVTTSEYTEDGKYVRKVKSFVLREGRTTKGQQHALDHYWSDFGLDFSKKIINFHEVFGNDAPVTLEIGFGMGRSLVEMAVAMPERNFVGIEVHQAGVGACILAAHEHGLKNLKVIHHDAVEVLDHMISNESLSCIQLFFPDPWHKKRHHKRRIVQVPFVEQLTEKLTIDGTFHLATDWENYAEHMIEVLEQVSCLVNTARDGNFIPRPEFRPKTKFEERGHRLGHGVWDIIFKREK